MFSSSLDYFHRFESYFLGLEQTTSIGRVLVHPTNSNILYLAAVGSYFSPNPERGVYKSTDGGNSWNKSLFISDSTGAIDIIMDPINPNTKITAGLINHDGLKFLRESPHLSCPTTYMLSLVDNATKIAAIKHTIKITVLIIFFLLFC
jgi:hypothetical protein